MKNSSKLTIKLVNSEKGIREKKHKREQMMAQRVAEKYKKLEKRYQSTKMTKSAVTEKSQKRGLSGAFHFNKRSSLVHQNSMKRSRLDSKAEVASNPQKSENKKERFSGQNKGGIMQWKEYLKHRLTRKRDMDRKNGLESSEIKNEKKIVNSQNRLKSMKNSYFEARSEKERSEASARTFISHRKELFSRSKRVSRVIQKSTRRKGSKASGSGRGPGGVSEQGSVASSFEGVPGSSQDLKNFDISKYVRSRRQQLKTMMKLKRRGEEATRNSSKAFSGPKGKKSTKFKPISLIKNRGNKAKKSAQSPNPGPRNNRNSPSGGTSSSKKRLKELIANNLSEKRGGFPSVKPFQTDPESRQEVDTSSFRFKEVSGEGTGGQNAENLDEKSEEDSQLLRSKTRKKMIGGVSGGDGDGRKTQRSGNGEKFGFPRMNILQKFEFRDGGIGGVERSDFGVCQRESEREATYSFGEGPEGPPDPQKITKIEKNGIQNFEPKTQNKGVTGCSEPIIALNDLDISPVLHQRCQIHRKFSKIFTNGKTQKSDSEAVEEQQSHISHQSHPQDPSETQKSAQTNKSDTSNSDFINLEKAIETIKSQRQRNREQLERRLENPHYSRTVKEDEKSLDLLAKRSFEFEEDQFGLGGQLSQTNIILQPLDLDQSDLKLWRGQAVKSKKKELLKKILGVSDEGRGKRGMKRISIAERPRKTVQRLEVKESDLRNAKNRRNVKIGKNSKKGSLRDHRGKREARGYAGGLEEPRSVKYSSNNPGKGLRKQAFSPEIKQSKSTKKQSYFFKSFIKTPKKTKRSPGRRSSPPNKAKSGLDRSFEKLSSSKLKSKDFKDRNPSFSKWVHNHRKNFTTRHRSVVEAGKQLNSIFGKKSIRAFLGGRKGTRGKTGDLFRGVTRLEKPWEVRGRSERRVEDNCRNFLSFDLEPSKNFAGKSHPRKTARHAQEKGCKALRVSKGKKNSKFYKKLNKIFFEKIKERTVSRSPRSPGGAESSSSVNSRPKNAFNSPKKLMIDLSNMGSMNSEIEQESSPVSSFDPASAPTLRNRLTLSPNYKKIKTSERRKQATPGQSGNPRRPKDETYTFKMANGHTHKLKLVSAVLTSTKYGEIFRALDMANGHEFIVKRVPKLLIQALKNEKQLRKEIVISKALSESDQILRYKGLLEDNQFKFLVFEPMEVPRIIKEKGIFVGMSNLEKFYNMTCMPLSHYTKVIDEVLEEEGGVERLRADPTALICNEILVGYLISRCLKACEFIQLRGVVHCNLNPGCIFISKVSH